MECTIVFAKGQPAILRLPFPPLLNEPLFPLCECPEDLVTALLFHDQLPVAFDLRDQREQAGVRSGKVARSNAAGRLAEVAERRRSGE